MYSLFNPLSRLFRLAPAYKKYSRHGFAPLISREHKLFVSLSAKAGSFFGACWFFYHQGVWGDVQNYGAWVHKYRQNVLYPSQEYNAALKDFQKQPDSYTKIKLVRNPYSRAVSSYLHVLKHPRLLERDTEGAFSDTAFSFEHFVRQLEQLDTRKCNTHYRTQTHAFERKANWSYDHIVKLESSFEEMPRLEAMLGLEQSPLEEFRESRHHSKRQQSSGYVGSTVFASGRGTHSPYPCFYNEELRDQIQKLYAEDFENYGYPIELDLPTT